VSKIGILAQETSKTTSDKTNDSSEARETRTVDDLVDHHLIPDASDNDLSLFFLKMNSGNVCEIIETSSQARSRWRHSNAS